MTQPPYPRQGEPGEPEPTTNQQDHDSAQSATPGSGLDFEYPEAGQGPGFPVPSGSQADGNPQESEAPAAQQQSQWAAPGSEASQHSSQAGSFPPPPPAAEWHAAGESPAPVPPAGVPGAGVPGAGAPGVQAGYQQSYQGQYQQPAYAGGYQQAGLMTPALNGARPVTAGKQILAWLIDGALIFLASMILGLLTFIPAVTGVAQSSVVTDRYGNVVSQDLNAFYAGLAASLTLFFVVMLVIYGIYWWLVATKGSTPGMAMMGQRLVSVETGQPVGWGKAFLRGVVVVVGSWLTSGLVWLLFWLSPLFDSTTGWFQGWADKMVRGVVIDTKAGRDTAKQ